MTRELVEMDPQHDLQAKHADGPTTELPKPWIKTPLVHSQALSKAAGCQIYLKLENLQPSGSFKSRGVGNYILQKVKKLASISPGAENKVHFYCSSSGNAGLGCVSAATTLGCPATVVIGNNTAPFMKAKVEASGATQVIQHGASWADADRHMRQVVMPAAVERGEVPVYVPPFDDPEIWNGNATLFEEVLEQLGEIEDHNAGRTSTSTSTGPQQAGAALVVPDAVICSVGGGGLFNGIMQAIEERSLNGQVGVVAVETNGADALNKSLKMGEHITLPAITSIVASLGALRVSARCYEYGQRPNVKSVVLEDRDAVIGCRKMADDQRMLVESSCGVAVAMCYDGRLKAALPTLNADSKVVLVVCGGSGINIDILNDYAVTYA